MPKDVHKNLKREAMDREISLSELLLERVVRASDKKDQKLIAQRKRALKRIDKLARGVSFKGLDYKELINYGRKY